LCASRNLLIGGSSIFLLVVFTSLPHFLVFVFAFFLCGVVLRYIEHRRQFLEESSILDHT